MFVTAVIEGEQSQQSPSLYTVSSVPSFNRNDQITGGSSDIIHRMPSVFSIVTILDSGCQGLHIPWK